MVIAKIKIKKTWYVTPRFSAFLGYIIFVLFFVFFGFYGNAIKKRKNFWYCVIYDLNASHKDVWYINTILLP